MTTSAALSTGGRSLRFGPLLMHMNTKLLAGRTILKFLNLFLTRFRAYLLATGANLLTTHLRIDKICKE
jgi:hypothetical protein